MPSSSGRPKAGKPPACVQFGPCRARRVRRTSENPTHRTERCRNCAKPLTHTPFENWVRARTSTSVDSVLALYNHVYGTNVCVKHAPRDSDTPSIQGDPKEWLCTTLQLGSVQDTYATSTPTFHIGDFVYCKRHTKLPTKLNIERLLRAQEFRKASHLITQYELVHGLRLLSARQYYNQHVRQRNAQP